MAMLTKVGQFNAQTTSGNQAVTGIGFAPRALIFWAVGATNNDEFNATWFTQGIGFTTGPANSYAQASAALASTSASTYRRVESVAIIQTNTSATGIVRRADLASLDSDGFTLNWTTQAASGNYGIIHYLALGGSDLTGVRAVNWQMPAVAGSKAVSGVGFQPDAVIHAHAGGVTTLNAAATATAAFGLGAMTANGDQWAAGYAGQSTTQNARNQEVTQAITLLTTAGAIAVQAAFTSMDADGFTLNFGLASGAYQAISLCLKGGKYKVGQFAKSVAAAPTAQAITGTGFTPNGVLLAGVEDIVRSGSTTAIAFGLGATDGTSEFATSLYGAATATRTSNDDSAKVWTKDNGAKVVVAEADMSSLDSNGFTLGWTTNDAVATSILYMAFGGASTPATATLPALTTTATSPSLTATAGSAATISTVTATASAPVITASAGSRATLGAVTATATAPVLTATAINPATANVPAVTASATAPALVASAGSRATIAAVTSTATSPAASAMAGAGGSLNAITATGVSPAPTANAGARGNLNAVTATTSIPSLTSAAGSAATLPAASATASAPSLTATAANPATATLPACTATGSAPALTSTAGARSTLPVSTASATAPVVAAVAGSGASIPASPATGTAPQPNATGGARGTLTATMVTTSVPTVTATGAASGVLASATVTATAPAPLSGTANPATATLGAVTATATIPASTAQAGARTSLPVAGVTASTDTIVVVTANGAVALLSVAGMTATVPALTARAGSLAALTGATVWGATGVITAHETIRQRLGLVERIRLPDGVTATRTREAVPVALSRLTVSGPVTLSRSMQPIPFATMRTAHPAPVAVLRTREDVPIAAMRYQDDPVDATRTRE